MASSIGGTGGSVSAQGSGGGDDKNVNGQKGIFKTPGGDYNVSKSGGQGTSGTVGKVKQLAAMFEQGGGLAPTRLGSGSNIQTHQIPGNGNVGARVAEDSSSQSGAGTTDSKQPDASSPRDSRVRSESSSSSGSIDAKKSGSSSTAKGPTSISASNFKAGTRTGKVKASIGEAVRAVKTKVSFSDSSSDENGPASISASNFKAGTRAGKVKASIGEAVQAVKTKVSLSGEKMKWAVKDNVASVKSKASSAASSSREACLHNCRIIKGQLVAKLGLTKIKKPSTSSQNVRAQMAAVWASLKSGLVNIKVKLQGLRAKVTANKDPELYKEIKLLGEGLDLDPKGEFDHEIPNVPEGTVELANNFAEALQQLRDDLEDIERRRQQ